MIPFFDENESSPVTRSHTSSPRASLSKSKSNRVHPLERSRIVAVLQAENKSLQEERDAQEDLLVKMSELLSASTAPNQRVTLEVVDSLQMMVDVMQRERQELLGKLNSLEKKLAESQVQNAAKDYKLQVLESLVVQHVLERTEEEDDKETLKTTLTTASDVSSLSEVSSKVDEDLVAVHERPSFVSFPRLWT